MPYDGPDVPLDALHAPRGAREGTLRVAMRASAYDTAAAAAPSLHGHPLTVADLEEQLARDDAERAGEPPEFVDAYAAAARAAAFGVAAFAPWRRLDELQRRALRARIGLRVAACACASAEAAAALAAQSASDATAAVVAARSAAALGAYRVFDAASASAAAAVARAAAACASIREAVADSALAAATDALATCGAATASVRASCAAVAELYVAADLRPRQAPHMGPQLARSLGVPPDYFVVKLYQMLQEQREILTWDPNGGIIIHDRKRLEAKLSMYFWHNRFTSFQRQLNNFGFHKKRKAEAGFVGTAEQQRNMAAYGHPLLVGQQPEAVRDPVSVEASRRFREGDNFVRKTGTLTSQQRRSSASVVTYPIAGRALRHRLCHRFSDALPVGGRRRRLHHHH